MGGGWEEVGGGWREGGKGKKKSPVLFDSSE